jgi:hypothetical protein
VEVEVQETMQLVALQLCHFKWAYYIMFSHHAAIRHLNSEPKSSGMLLRVSCDKGP